MRTYLLSAVDPSSALQWILLQNKWNTFMVSVLSASKKIPGTLPGHRSASYREPPRFLRGVSNILLKRSSDPKNIPEKVRSPSHSNPPHLHPIPPPPLPMGGMGGLMRGMGKRRDGEGWSGMEGRGGMGEGRNVYEQYT